MASTLSSADLPLMRTSASIEASMSLARSAVGRPAAAAARRSPSRPRKLFHSSRSPGEVASRGYAAESTVMRSLMAATSTSARPGTTRRCACARRSSTSSIDRWAFSTISAVRAATPRATTRSVPSMARNSSATTSSAANTGQIDGTVLGFISASMIWEGMVARARILIAEDDDLTLELLTTVLRAAGHDVTAVADGQLALDEIGRSTFDLVVGDVQMPRASGLEILDALNARAPDTPLILVTAYANPGAAMDAISRGAADYLAKPVDVVALQTTVARTLERKRLAGENRQLRRAAVEPKALIGTSAAMLELYKQIAQIAPTDTTVLITGESGSGKELVARMLHERSARAAQPFVAVNCGGLAETLLESELFGHERGAFTGAHSQRRGLFESANGGTVFLDEIGDVPVK